MLHNGCTRWQFLPLTVSVRRGSNILLWARLVRMRTQWAEVFVSVCTLNYRRVFAKLWLAMVFWCWIKKSDDLICSPGCTRAGSVPPFSLPATWEASLTRDPSPRSFCLKWRKGNDPHPTPHTPDPWPHNPPCLGLTHLSTKSCSHFWVTFTRSKYFFSNLKEVKVNNFDV